MRHRSILGEAMLAMLDIPNNPQNQAKKALRVFAKYLPDKDSEQCLAIFGVGSSELMEMAECGHWDPWVFQQRVEYEKDAIRLDPDTYGTGFIVLHVMFGHQMKDLMFSRILYHTFDQEWMDVEVPGYYQWQVELWQNTGSVSLVEAGIPHTCCEHCRNDIGYHHTHGDIS